MTESAQVTAEKKLTREQRRMRAVVAKFQSYVETYTDQSGYDTYSDMTFLDDMLYGIGISLAIGTAKDNTGPGGYVRFKQELREHLK
jgi:hypothetical protein